MKLRTKERCTIFTSRDADSHDQKIVLPYNENNDRLSVPQILVLKINDKPGSAVARRLFLKGLWARRAFPHAKSGRHS
jgi:hypothetical protein